MSWGATSFTPIVTRNEPPFGFHEVQNPPDFKVCNQNPWGTGDRVKAEIQERLRLNDYRKKLNITDKSDFMFGYDMDYDKAQKLRCKMDSQDIKAVMNSACDNNSPSQLGCGPYGQQSFGDMPVNHHEYPASFLEKFVSGEIAGFRFTETFFLIAVAVAMGAYFYRKGIKLSFK